MHRAIARSSKAQGAFGFFDRIQRLCLLLDDLQSAYPAFRSNNQDVCFVLNLHEQCPQKETRRQRDEA